MSRDPHEFELYYDDHQDDHQDEFIVYDQFIDEDELIETYGIEFAYELYDLDDDELEDF